jgi:mannose-6-phosphate isomerase-like protein (cupin superfamily)
VNSPVDCMSGVMAGNPAIRAHGWGSESAQDVHPRARIRHLVLRPGATIAPTVHSHRTEHWIVVQGIGTARIDARAHRICENRALTVPAGAAHALENTGRIDLHLIAVEIGSYLGEDDVLELAMARSA